VIQRKYIAHGKLAHHQTYQLLAKNIEEVIQGQSSAIRKLLACFFTGGHVLLEDVPGTGKTTLAKALACSINVNFQRIQFTPDLLPTDISGVSIFNQGTQAFEFHPGPVFTNILLADEINRASPRTQSALLEAMGEGQVSIDRDIRKLDSLFFVIATQNPVEYHGTYPLPEAQMDRFSMRFSLGYVSRDDEIDIMTRQDKSHPLDSLKPCLNKEEVLQLKQKILDVYLSDEIKHYIVDLVRKTREIEGVLNGASTRASLTLMRVAQAAALFDGLDFVTPEHVQELAKPVIAHRLLLDPQATFSGRSADYIVDEVLDSIPVPV